MAGFFDTNSDKFEYCPGNVPAGRPSNRPPGRGVPDVSLYSFNFAGLTSGKAMAVGGTSASSPMFGGLLLLLHACLEDAGVCSSGAITFVQLNRFLYKVAVTHPCAFIGVVHGHNMFYASRTIQASRTAA